ncbi:MAG: hypothetical protein IJ407_00420 [Clostridia bacterium]|nr:hypothetical protein [Clostridia bacterium]
MKNKSFILFILIISLFLSGCSMSGEEIRTLLTPPAMSSGREALSQAINAAIGEGYELVYPQAGSYRTGIISVDLTGDKTTEALCFYRPSGKEDQLCFLVMENRGESWAMLAKGESEAASVGRVAFGDMDGDGMSEIVVGWQYHADTDGSYDVYTIEDKEAESRYSGLYTRFAMLGDAPNKLAVISRNSATKSVTASLVGLTDGKIGVVNTVPMYDRTTDYLAIETGKTTAGLPAVYVDSQQENGQCVTEVLSINEEGRLTNELLTQLSTATMRNTAVTCRDVNGDGILEVPREEALPAYTRSGVTENLYLTRWTDYDGKSLTDISASFVDMTEKIMVDFPSSWVGKVTVERGNTADRSFVFKTMKGENLFTVRIFALAEYSNELGETGWRRLYSDSDHICAVYCEPDNSMRINYMQVYGLFSVIG